VAIDETLIENPFTHAAPHNTAGIEVTYPGADGTRRVEVFSRPLRIGRDASCEIILPNNRVSRLHLEAIPEQDGWRVRDLASRNGTLHDGQPIDELLITDTTVLEVGRGGPTVRFMVSGTRAAETNSTTPPPTPIPPEPVPHPSRVRRTLLTLLVLGPAGASLGYWLWQHYRPPPPVSPELVQLAQEMFYGIKNLELQIADLEDQVGDIIRREGILRQIRTRRQELRALERSYERFVETQIPLPSNDVDQLILRMARRFGECDVAAPAGFVAEVKRYLGYWQSSSRLANAIATLQREGYTPIIVRELRDQDLPPQFLYLALQESNFNYRAVGPMTRYGHAKGMWQFIPDTAERFGLKTGPLKDQGVYDPQDERHDVAKATRAAAKYLKAIYRTDAQASGLLVMASYNWGEGNIIKRLRRMPDNPRERNFWALLQESSIPKETYGYVFYIFSAAVIGENPQLFGFDFPNPLSGF